MGAPSADWVALNTDGALKNNLGQAGGGGFFRGWRAEWMGGFAERMGVCSSVRAELRAILRGLRLAQEKGYRKLIVYVDSLVVAGMLKDNMLCSARHNTLVQQCRRILQLPDWEVKVNHCFRETNRVADALANLGIGLNCEFMYFNEPPSEVSSSLFADRVGAKYPRLIMDQ